MQTERLGINIDGIKKNQVNWEKRHKKEKKKKKKKRGVKEKN
jgi:hypothetical protein